MEEEDNYLKLLDFLADFDDDNTKPVLFGEHSERVKRKIRYAMIKYLNILKVKNPLDMTFFFSMKNKDTGSVCAGKMEQIGGWRCMDCVKNENTIFCQSCWSEMKDKHKNHNIIFLTTVNGTCDCGDPNSIDPVYFCSKHKGPMTNENDITLYIQNCLGQQAANDLKVVTKKVFVEMAGYLIRAIQEKKTNENSFLSTVASFFDFINTPCNTSIACMHMIAELLLENYPYKTKHICLQIKDGKTRLVKSTLFSHDCCCPFIRLLMPIWPMGKERLIYSFLHNYKIRKTFGLLYFLLYGELTLNCLSEFGDLSVQYISDDVIKDAFSTEGLIENIYVSLEEIFTIYLKTKNYKNTPYYIPLYDALQKLVEEGKEKNKYVLFQELVFRLKCDTSYILKNSSLNYLGRNTKIICKIIKLICLMHNVNSIKALFPHPLLAQEDKYIIHLLDAEIWLLDIFSAYVSIFDFSSINLVKEVFNYFSKKINSKEYIIPSDEYTFHIPLYRAFSIFLNRYCFYYANKNNTDILHGLESAIKIFPNYKECFRIMIESIYKVFGYVTACGEEFFKYYGENMVEYEYLYYYNYQFVYRDFCLMKYLLALKGNDEYFSFDNVLQLCQVENSNKPLEDNILRGKKRVSPDKWLNEDNKKYMKFSSKILRLILIILRNNTCLIWNLGGSYQMLQHNKIEDNLLKDIINKDKNNFIELTKELIVNQTFIKQNLALYTDIYDYIFLSLKEVLGHNNIKELILSLTNKTLTQDKKAKFSIKDENLNYLDLNYIIYPTHKSTVEKYISDFKKNLVSIFNTHFYPVNKYENMLTIEGYKKVYFNEENCDFLFRFTAYILRREGYFVLNQFFLGVLLNYLATFFCLDYDQFIFFREQINNKILKIMNVLDDNNLTDDVQISYCNFIIQKIAEHDKIYTISYKKTKKEDEIQTPKNENIINDNKNEINENKNEINENKNEINIQPKKKNAKISMKERMKNKFKKKNDNISNKYGIEKIKIEKKKNTEACIYCLKPIDNDDIKKPYGKIGDFLHDNYLSNAFFQVIRKEFKKYYEADYNLKEFDQIYYQPLDRKNIRIISCNHLIHFSCYFEAYMKGDLKNSLNIFQCPLCHKFSEIYIPMVDQYTEEETFGIFKGYNISYIYNFGKQNQEILKKREDALKEKSKIIFDDEKEDINEIKDKNQEIPSYDISNIDETNIQNIDINMLKKDYPDFINACKHYIEGFIGMKLLINSVNMETDLFKSLLNNFLIIFSIQYRDLLDFFENTDDRKTSVNLWKNLILSFRLSIKINYMDEGFFFCKLYTSIEELKTLQFDGELDELVKNDTLRIKLCKLLFLLALLFDYNEIEGYEKYIIYMCLPIFGFGFFFKDIYFKNTFTFYQQKFLDALTEEKLMDYLKNENSLNIIFIHIIKQLLITKLLMKNEVDFDKVSLELNDMLDLLDLSELKNKSFFEILEYLDKTLLEDKNKKIYEVFYPKNNYQEVLKILLNKHIEVAKNEKCDNVLNPSLFGSCLPIVYNFIDLPESAIDFEYQVYNARCEVCKRIGKNSLICLDCGKKVCDSRKCLAKYNSEALPGFIVHTKICGGGRSAFLQTYDCSVLFVTNKVVFKKFVPFYINEFGEGITKKNFGKEFKLCKDEVKKALTMFTKYTYSNAPIIY